MELLKLNNYFVTYQRQGNNRNGNPIYLVNVFKESSEHLFNVNLKFNRKLDKYGNIKIVSYDIESNINDMLNK